MKKKSLFILTACLLALALATASFAIYVPCLTEDEPHDMSEWIVVETRDDGGTLLSRTCSKCGYEQQGYGAAGTDGVATTKEGTVTITTLIGVPEAVQNPATGAAL